MATQPDTGTTKRITAMGAALMDQSAQSLTNLVVGVIAANSLSTVHFGAFALGLLFLNVSWASLRVLLVEPFIVLHGTQGAPAAGKISFLLGGTGIAVLVAALAIACATFTPYPVNVSLYSIATVLPLIIALDMLRGYYLASAQPARAARLCFGWFALAASALLIIWKTGSGGFWSISLAFGLTTIPIVIMAVIDTTKTDFFAIEWGKLLRFGKPLVLEYLVLSSTVQLLGVVIAMAGGLAESAGFRGAVILGGPLGTIINGMRLGVLNDARRYRKTHGDKHWARYLIFVSSIFFIAGAIVTVFTLFISHKFGHLLLSESWQPTQDVVLPFCLAVLFTSFHLTSGAVLRARELPNRSFKTRLNLLPITIIPSWVGAFYYGAEGACWGLFVGIVLSIPGYMSAAIRPAKSDHTMLATRSTIPPC